MPVSANFELLVSKLDIKKRHLDRALSNSAPTPKSNDPPTQNNPQNNASLTITHTKYGPITHIYSNFFDHKVKIHLHFHKVNDYQTWQSDTYSQDFPSAKSHDCLIM